MSDVLNITDFLDPVNRYHLSHDEGYQEGQIGKAVHVYEEELPDLDAADIVLVGCGEERGDGSSRCSLAADVVRSRFYELLLLAQEIKIADVGNIKCGAGLADTYAAAYRGRRIDQCRENSFNTGGSHDLTLPQYEAYKSLNHIVEATVVDGLIDIQISSSLRSEEFFNGDADEDPNFIRHYNHIGFQSYLVILICWKRWTSCDFDCYRLGSERTYG